LLLRPLAAVFGRLSQELGDTLSCTFFPASCLLCQSFLPHLASSPICQACWAEEPEPRLSCCTRCGEDLFLPSVTPDRTLCRACRLAPPAFVRAVSYCVYDGSVRGAIHALKYDRVAPVAKVLGEHLAGAIEQLFNVGDAKAPQQMLLIPVPLHPARLRQRGFNQARALASEALRILRMRHPERRLEMLPGGLVRQRATESQAGLTPRQRRQNLRGVFFVPDTAFIRDQHILLVDDIYTTGATARACSQVLMQAGAASVHVATVARAQRQFPNLIPGPITNRADARVASSSETIH
jgi:ComF family protein